jgi:hypothetical protein
MPEDQQAGDGDEHELDVRLFDAPDVEVAGHHRAGGQEHEERRQGAPSEAPRDGAQLLGVVLAAQCRDHRRGEDELPADEEGHGQEMKPADQFPGGQGGLVTDP